MELGLEEISFQQSLPSGVTQDVLNTPRKEVRTCVKYGLTKHFEDQVTWGIVNLGIIYPASAIISDTQKEHKLHFTNGLGTVNYLAFIETYPCKNSLFLGSQMLFQVAPYNRPFLRMRTDYVNSFLHCSVTSNTIKNCPLSLPFLSFPLSACFVISLLCPQFLLPIPFSNTQTHTHTLFCILL